MIFDYIDITENSNVVEVGSGSGQATLPILQTGCKLTAIEYGEQFSKLLLDKYKEYSEQQAKEIALIAEKYGFTDIKYAMFNRTRTFLAKEYTSLLNTYSDHIAIDEPIRKEFYNEIENEINKNGESFTVYDTIDLQLARKP